jgi:hypothetical protein
MKSSYRSFEENNYGESLRKDRASPEEMCQQSDAHVMMKDRYTQQVEKYVASALE